MIGTTIAHYEILDKLGAGGMGVVYRGRDTRLDRDVAIKALPEDFASDPERLARFEREAKVLASLNHPHIASIHGMEKAEGSSFLILELVEGEDLAERIEKGPIPAQEALELGRQIAEALEAAHQHGIVHRDLKPANVKVTPEGQVKVLDFGLAKAVVPKTPEIAVTRSPTLTAEMTREGTLLGTAAYMSPEQARGQEAGKQADIWAFGCVLYEMLTGKRTFARPTGTDTLAAVLEREPDWELLPVATPPLARSVLRRCLEKDTRQRLHDSADLRLEIEEAMAAPSDRPSGASASQRPSGRARRISAYAGWLLALLLAAVIGLVDGPSPEVVGQPLAFDIASPNGTRLDRLAISPDGRMLVMAAESDATVSSLWLLDLVSREVLRLDGTEGATDPFWSPDGHFIGFFAADQLKRLELATRSVIDLCEVASPRGGSWNRGGTILFGTAQQGLLAVPAAGGQPTTVFTMDRGSGETTLRFPSFLPDGEHFLFYVRNTKQAEATGVWIGSIHNSERRQLLRATSFAVYSPPGYLLYRRGGALEARPFDAQARAFQGDPVTVSNDLWYDPTISSLTNFSASDNGILVLRTGGIEQTELLWLNRRGNLTDQVWKPANYLSVSLSPDGTRALLGVTSEQSEQRNLWLYDLTAATPAQFTFQGDSGFTAHWSPDASRVMFTAFRETGAYSIWEKSVSGGREPILRSPEGFVTDWTGDGESLVFQDESEGFWNLGVLSASDGSTKPFKPAHANQMFGQVSADGHWIAYQSDQTGRSEVYVESFPTPGTFWKVSSRGGHQPQWSPDGDELFYLAPDRTLMSVAVQRGEGTFEWRQPQALFRTQAIGLGALRLAATYAVGPEGDTFLVNSRRQQPPTPAAVLVNWHSLIERR
jgi:serine/threonine protein kinase